MGKVSCLVVTLIACMAGCVSTSTGPDDPADVETETAEVEESEVDESESDRKFDEVEQVWVDEDATEEAEEESQPEEGAAREETGAEAEPPPAKKGCPDLDEGTCKITVGCAWNSIKKCVDE